MEAARDATPADLSAIEDLARAAVGELTELRGGAVWSQHQARREPIGDELRELLARPDGQGAVVVGTIDDAPVGYGVTRMEPLADATTLAIITDLYVDPAARGIGLGEAMMDLLVAHAERHGAVGIDSLALPGDRATKNFFETFGLKARAIVVHRSLGRADERA